MNSKIKGIFKRIIYQSNNFNIVVFHLHPNQEIEKIDLNIKNKNYINIICSEINFDLSVDYEIEIKYERRETGKYKDNYYLINHQIIVLDERESIIRFLSSSIFKGISTKTASKLVDNLGIEFIKDINKFENEIIKLIGNKKADIIIDGWNANNEINNIIQIFIREKLSINILNLIRNSNFNNSIKDFLENHIFDLIEITTSINFQELDKIAKIFFNNYSINLSNQYLILLEIYKLEYEGSTINHLEKIYRRVCQYRFMEITDFKEMIKELNIKNLVIIQQNKQELTSKKMFNKEKYIFERIENLVSFDNNYLLDDNQLIVEEHIDNIQRNAILNSLKKSISIITGGPGTGKTLLIKLILKNLEHLKIKKIELLAPTGKAAIQISKRTFKKAKTFHSLLRWNEKFFEMNENNPLDSEVIIIDEFSMVNIEIFYSLLKACPNLKHLIMIGDKDQLPPIGPGSLLNDFINSQKIPTSILEKVYRQSEGSLIAKNSSLIKNNQLPIFDEKESILLEPLNIEEKIINNLKENINEIQILIPMYNGDFGINNINSMVQNFYNQNNPILFNLKNKNYYLNDKVIQLENDNNKNVFNGEIGNICDVVFEKNDIKEIKIKFDDEKIVSYTPGEFNSNINLAYAISIHKFQGSESPEVLFLLLDEHYSMFSKKMFYTGYTRARNKITLISEKKLILHCINRDHDSNRKCNILNLLNDL